MDLANELNIKCEQECETRAILHCVKCRAAEVLRAQEVELLKLRQENDFLKQHGRRMRIADAIVSSEQFMWLMVGSNHPESQRDGLRPAYEMWRQNGGVGDLRKSVQAMEELARLDEELGLNNPPSQKEGKLNP